MNFLSFWYTRPGSRTNFEINLNSPPGRSEAEAGGCQCVAPGAGVTNDNHFCHPERMVDASQRVCCATHEAADPPHERQPLGAPTVFNDMWALDLQSTIDQQRRAYRAARKIRPGRSSRWRAGSLRSRSLP
jgi:hypothetical protein